MENSSKNLWRLVNSGMTSNSKVGLGFEIHSNKEVLSYEEEMNRTVFQCTEKDFLNKPLYSRFSKTDNFKGVPHPLTGDYTPKPQEEIDDSFLSHLIKDCDYYEKKMAREAEFKKQRVFNTGNRVAKPVWTNANKVNHANHFIPRPLQLNAGRLNVNSVRHNVNSVRSNVNTGRSKQPVPTCTSNSFSPVRPQVNKFNQRSHFSKSHSPVNVNSVRPNVNTGRVNVNSVRPNVNTGRVNVNSVKSNVNTGRTNVNPVRPRVNTDLDSQYLPRPQTALVLKDLRPIVRNTARMTYSHAVKGNWGTAVKTSAEFAIPGQTTTGKESSNPFMAGSLPKTIQFCDSLKSDEDSFKLIELMILCTNFLTMVLDLENTKTSQQSEIASLKRSRSRTHKGRIDIGDINTEVEVTLINETQGRINDIIADEDITLIPKLIIKLLKM
ncbi:hypothetical protein Tco_1106440 [Tanacetum coccineum]